MKTFATVVTALLATGLLGACGTESDAPAETTKTVYDNRSTANGLRTQFAGGGDELVVGTDIAPGTYETKGRDCTFLVRSTKGGEPLTGATVTTESARVMLETEGSTIESSSGCSDWVLKIPAN